MVLPSKAGSRGLEQQVQLFARQQTRFVTFTEYPFETFCCPDPLFFLAL